MMSKDNIEKRTSRAQLKWLFEKIERFLYALFSHIYRFRGVYGFLSGSFLTLLTLSAVIWYGILAYPLPWKVTNPADPRFDVTEFKFSDYSKSGELGHALSCLFPKGTSKSEVDEVLGDIGGAKIAKIEIKNPEYYHPRQYHYSKFIFRDQIGRFLFPTPNKPEIPFGEVYNKI